MSYRILGRAVLVLVLPILILTALPAKAATNGLVLQGGSALDLGQGGSRVYDNGDLHIATDNDLYIDAAWRTKVAGVAEVGKALWIDNINDGSYNGSQLIDNNDLHVVTDNYLYLDAPVMTYIQGGLTVAGSVSLPTDSVTGSMIADSTLVEADLATGAVTSAKILDGTVANADLAGSIAYSKLNLTDSIVSADITDGTITADDLASGAVTTAKILDATIATADLADSAVTSAKIAADTIVAEDIATGAVTTTEILDGTVANADLADADLQALAGLTASDSNIIVGNGTAWVAESGDTARTSLGLAIGTNVQAYDADLTTYAGITPSANIQSLLGSADYSAARTNLGLAIGTNVQAYDAQLADVAGLAVADGNIIVGDGANFVAESGDTARTSLGLAIGTNVQAYDADLTTYAGITPSANIQSLLGSADYATARDNLGVEIGQMFKVITLLWQLWLTVPTLVMILLLHLARLLLVFGMPVGSQLQVM